MGEGESRSQALGGEKSTIIILYKFITSAVVQRQINTGRASKNAELLEQLNLEA